MRTHLLLNSILFLILSLTTFADVRYVSTTGTSTYPYLSWDTAADSIQKCLNACNDGDTVYVANGIYKENISIYKQVYLCGLSMDSTIIDGSTQDTMTIGSFASTKISNFNLYGREMWWVVWAEDYLELSNCKISSGGGGVAILGHSSRVDNIIMNNLYKGYDAGYSGCTNYLTNSVIIINQELGKGVHAGIGGDYVFNNNIILFSVEHLASSYGIFASWPNRITINNNLINGFSSGISFDLLDDSAFVTNNVITHCGEGIFTQSDRISIRNNIFTFHSYAALNGDYFNENYNLYWKNWYDLNGWDWGYNYGDSDIVARDPMFVKDTLANALLDFDYHLQAYSPAIDKGDPSLLDKDNSRSDIGMAGGPAGEEYTYQNLSPSAPVNFTATVQSGIIKLKWNKNPEADTSYYRVYRDTVQGFTIDTTKIIASVTDTSFTDQAPENVKHLYYKITAMDNANNESHPSVELVVNLTTTDEKETALITDYNLYQNYPNPFNPTTRIRYRLKESGLVKLNIYSITGELIRVLVNKEQGQGYYEVEFNGKDLASSIYLYRIEVTGKGNIPVYSDMKKLVYLK